MLYLVTKEYVDTGIRRIHGEVVNADGYRNREKLIQNRYLAELDRKAKTVKCEAEGCERSFINQKSLEAHYLSAHSDQIEVVDDGGKE